MEWVSFDEIKKTVSLKMVIDRYGFLLRPSGPNKLRGKCPLPNHSSKDNNESFIATLDKGVGGAWSCHSQSCAATRGGKLGGNALDLVAAMESCSIRDAAIKLQMWFLVPAAGESPARQRTEPHTELRAETSSSVEPKNQLAAKEKNEGGGESEANKPLSFELQNIDHAHPYLRDRGITEEIARTFGVGYFSGKGSMRDKVVIKIHNRDGDLVAYAGRAVDGSEPKYKFPPGFRKSLELYNLHRVRGESAVVVVEGFFDCMKVVQAGFPCVALMGSTMSEAQEKLLAEEFGCVILMFDGDDAGRRATEDVADRLKRVVFHVRTIELEDGVQPDQLSSSEIRREVEGVMQ